MLTIMITIDPEIIEARWALQVLNCLRAFLQGMALDMITGLVQDQEARDLKNRNPKDLTGIITLRMIHISGGGRVVIHIGLAAERLDRIYHHRVTDLV